MAELRALLSDGLTHRLHKWNHYFAPYERHFAPYRQSVPADEKIIILEIGVQYGGSLELWTKFFGGPERVRVFGADVDPACVERAQSIPGVEKILIGDQASSDFLQRLIDEIPCPHIIIDDGGHTMAQQNLTFEMLYPHLRPGGIWLTEDTHTSYWPQYSGGYGRPETFVERTKSLIDQLHGFHHDRPSPLRSCMTGLHVYDSMVFIEKPSEPLQPPFSEEWLNGQLLATHRTNYFQ